MFWIWARGGPRAVFAFVVVGAGFVVLFVAGSRVAPWLPPFLIVPAFGLVLLVASRSSKHRGGDDGGAEDPE